MGGGSSSEGKRGLLGNKSSKKGTSDDGCIGNEKVRTVILSALLIAFASFAMALIVNTRQSWIDANNVPLVSCDICQKYVNAYTTSMIGLILFIVGGVIAVIIVVMDNETIKKVSGVILVIAGICYLIGTIWQIDTFRQSSAYALAEGIGGDTKRNTDATLAAQFGEAMLPSVGALLLGLDLWIHFMEDEWKRLLCNLLNIWVVSGLCQGIYWILTDNNVTDYSAYPAIAVGYTILFWVSLIYIILWIFQCCTCDCKDTACIRIIMAVGLIIGGILTSIGYYILADDRRGDFVSFYIGLTVFVGGYACVWALDIAFDDIKSKSK